MNRLKLAAIMLLAFASKSYAAADPVSIETKWNVKTFSISTTGVTSATFDIGGFGAAGYAILGGTQVANGVDGTTYGTNVTITTNTVNVIGFSYSALPLGGSASLQIAQTIRTPAPAGTNQKNPNGFNTNFPGAAYFTTPQISTSSAISIPNSVPMSDTFTAEVKNPVFIFSGLTSAATLYFSVDYGVPGAQ